MRDFLNQELAVGDHVVVCRSGSRLQLRQIVKFSVKMVQISNPDAQYAWERKNISVYPYQLVKILPEQLTWYAISR